MSKQAFRKRLKRTLLREIQNHEFDCTTTEIAQRATARDEFYSDNSDSDKSVTELEIPILPIDDIFKDSAPQSPSSKDSQQRLLLPQTYDCENNLDASSISHPQTNFDKDMSSSGEESSSDDTTDGFYYYSDSENSSECEGDQHTKFPCLSGNSSQGNDEKDSDPNFAKLLVNWTFNNMITHKALDELLVILRDHGHSYLPKKAVTLLQTPRNISSEVVALGSGDYWYHGLLNCLEAYLPPSLRTCDIIEIDFFVDGISPYGKPSKSVHLWPISGRIISEGVATKPFVIALWCGSSHEPDNIDAFLKPFLDECITLMNGFVLNGVSHKLKIRFGIADAPARSLIKKTKPHQSHVCCERCEIRCVHVNQTIAFPIVSTCRVRTDESFQNKTDQEYHKGTSLLEKIMKMVTQFPLEPLHLVDLGVTKRFLKMLVKRKASKVYLKPSTLAQLDNLIELLSVYSPSEFGQWKPKGIKNSSSFKGKELKRFLKYDGILSMWLLEEMLPDEHKGVFELFLNVSMGIRILSDRDLYLSYADDANYLLQEFVKNSAKVFGPHFVVFNVHHLIHLANDCKLHGTLDTFDAYLYESYLGQLGRFLHAPGRPLPQIIARILERKKHGYVCNSDFKAELSQPRYSGRTDGLAGESYDVYHGQEFAIRVSSVNDHCCLTKSREVIIVENIVKTGDDVFFVGRGFLVQEPFFELPLDSTLVDIFKVSKFGPINHWPLSAIKRKCFLMPLDLNDQTQRFDNGCLAVPFTH